VNLAGARVVVTGASRGIGESLARKCAARGARVALVARSEQPLEGPEVQPARLHDRNGSHRGSGPLSHELPGHQVRMVLHLGDQDLVPRPEHGAPIALRHKVQGGGGACGEDDFGWRGRAKEYRGELPGPLVGCGRFFAQGVNPAVDVGISSSVVPVNGLDDRGRLLRRGGVVEIDQGPAPHDAAENWKIGPHLPDIPDRRGPAPQFLGRDHGDGSHAQLLTPIRSRTRWSSACRTGSEATSSTTSAANA